ncbi:PAS domain-containing protein [Novosphingobium sp. 1949]|uniref:PAS domain-containing protein n=1 Tax=Novosphingobium organovorum TaxID=2930092 RepID=A0ABT0BC43_9SPHN|nr:PAS domain-containing protein [Novosphingobium organovorum]MCJ2182608.1 PAS domain-containing protein [Novosphingobium organovorum]
MGYVSAAEFVRKFARFRDEAHDSPVFITHHGRETHVLCPIDVWNNIGSGQPGKAAGKRNDSANFALADWIDDGIIACDEAMNVVFANRNAHALVRAKPGSLVGLALTEALPAVAGSLLEVQARQSLVHGHPNMADIPSPFIDGAWLRFQSFLLDDRLVIRLHDITQEVERHFKANVKEAILQALDAHGGISYVRVSLRGTIDRVDTPFCRLLDLPEERLIGVTLTDLIAVSDKVAFRDTLERVLRGEDAQPVSTHFLTNRGDFVGVRMALVRLQGVYGCEGAIAVLTEERSASA